MTDGNRWEDPKPRKSLDDLQALRTEMAASVGGDPTNLRQHIAAMVNEKLASVRASTQGGDISQNVVPWGEPIVIRTWAYSQHYVPTISPITQLLYSEARAALYEEAMRHLRDEFMRLFLGTSHCHRCHYSSEGKYCGLGMDMVISCIHRIDNQ